MSGITPSFKLNPSSVTLIRNLNWWKRRQSASIWLLFRATLTQSKPLPYRICDTKRRGKRKAWQGMCCSRTNNLNKGRTGPPQPMEQSLHTAVQTNSNSTHQITINTVNYKTKFSRRAMLTCRQRCPRRIQKQYARSKDEWTEYPTCRVSRTVPHGRQNGMVGSVRDCRIS
jgi:hypothetical protein